ncbi:MAG TPA: MlaD family protein [Kofleriaceae bacterium]|nr:MlaD family protein [Kofleriaceae bacterium]
MRWVTRLTTLAVIGIIVAGFALLIRAKMPSIKVAGTFHTYAKFRDGSRLASGSPVVIAGVRVGVIEKLTVDGQLARIDMQLQDGLDLPVDSFATRRADSLFGDSYIEIIPSGGADGAGTTRLLRSGEPITHVVEGGSTDAVLRSIASAMPRIDNALDTVHDMLLEGRKWASGPLDDRLAAGDTWLAEGHIERPLDSADHAVARLDDLTARGADAVSRGRPEVTRTFDRLDHAIASARTKMRSVKQGLVSGLTDAREGLDRIDPQIEQAREVVAAINDGKAEDWKGKLGHQINDPALGERIDDLTQSGRDAVASLNPFRSWLGLRVEYNVFARAVRFYATAEIRARNDKFYLVEVERGPLGALPNDRLSDVANAPDYVRSQEVHDNVRFTAQFGKQLGMFRVRGGIKDSTFGLGGDALLLDGRLKLSADVYGSFQPTPRVKLAAALAVFRWAYVMAGVDDALNSPGYLPILPDNAPVPVYRFDEVRFGRDYFVGTTLIFNDEDIAVLMRLYGALIIGLLL